jgi:hypothetical protein
MTLRIYLHVTNTHNTKGQLVLRNTIIVNKIIMNPLAGNLILYQLFRLCSVKCDMLMGYEQRARRDTVKTTTVLEALLLHSRPVTNYTTKQNKN